MEKSKRRDDQTPPSPLQHIKKGCLSTAATLGEGFGYLKAAAVGLSKRITAKTEREATDADMQAAKMQVAAADRAEDIKKRLQ